MSVKMKTIFSIICFSLFILLYSFLETLFHEIGHALVVLLYGGTISKFVLYPNPYVSASYVDFTIFGTVLMHIAGILLPMVIGIIAVSLYNPKIKFMGYHICYMSGSVFLAFTLLQWAMIPFISLFTMAPPQNDMTKFMKVTGFPPLFMFLSMLLLIVVFLFLSYKKGIWEKVKEQTVTIRIIVIFMMIIIIGSSIVVNTSQYIKYFSAACNSSFTVKNALEEKSHEIQFTLEQSKTYAVEVVTQSRGFVTAIRIVKENNEVVYQNIAEKFQFTSTMELPESNYTLILTYFENYESVEQFLNNTWQGEISLEVRQNLEKIFSHDNGGDYSIDVSIQIR